MDANRLCEVEDNERIGRDSARETVDIVDRDQLQSYYKQKASSVTHADPRAAE